MPSQTFKKTTITKNKIDSFSGRRRIAVVGHLAQCAGAHMWQVPSRTLELGQRENILGEVEASGLIVS